MTTADPMHDQALAALDEAARLVASVPGDDVKRSPITSRVLAKWFRGGPFAHGLVWYDPEAAPIWTSCGHVDTPQLCFGLGNWPGHLMCGSCMIANAELSNNDCDWCGACPQTDDRVTLHPAVYPIGPAIVILALCGDHVGSTHTNDTHSPPCTDRPRF